MAFGIFLMNHGGIGVDEGFLFFQPIVLPG
jgi:hypothetical protein